MEYPLCSLCSEKYCKVLSIDELQGVTLDYQNKVTKIPYSEWKKIEQYTISYFSFCLEKIMKQYNS